MAKSKIRIIERYKGSNKAMTGEWQVLHRSVGAAWLVICYEYREEFGKEWKLNRDINLGVWLDYGDTQIMLVEA